MNRKKYLILNSTDKIHDFYMYYLGHTLEECMNKFQCSISCVWNTLDFYQLKKKGKGYSYKTLKGIISEDEYSKIFNRYSESSKLSYKHTSPEKRQYRLDINVEKALNRTTEEKLSITIKRRKTKLLKYGDPYYNNKEKACHTRLDKSAKDKEITSQKISKASKQIWEKRTVQEKNEILAKAISTKRKNKTFTKSQPEDDYYNYLLSIYDKEDIFRQYKESRYPFFCDFYIKSEDKFIEVNKFWMHGGKPYNECDLECQLLLKKWKEKALTKPIFNAAIKTWTVSDPLKLKTAQKNNLNYITVY